MNYLNKDRARVENSLKKYLPKERSSSRLGKAMSYSVLAGGKRIRPILALLSARACGGDVFEAMPAACAIEFIHTFTLIHDDLPAIDNSGLRRGKPTCHMKFGAATALLAGDALCVLAFKTVAQYIPGEKGLKVIREISLAAGIDGVIAGEAQDIEFERKKISPDRLRSMYELKTGALITAAVRCGAIIAGASEPKLGALTRYAKHLGFAFQIVDDILDIEGKTVDTGKPVGLDMGLQKSTYPGAVGLKKAKEVSAREIEAAIYAIKDLGAAGAPLRDIAAYIAKRNK